MIKKTAGGEFVAGNSNSHAKQAETQMGPDSGHLNGQFFVLDLAYLLMY